MNPSPRTTIAIKQVLASIRLEHKQYSSRQFERILYKKLIGDIAHEKDQSNVKAPDQ